MVLYRKYRPQKLSELVGQDHIKLALGGAFASSQISHAYLFSGPRGSGKTTTARILAKVLNCKKSAERHFSEPCGECDHCLAISQGNFLDLIEIDAASNRGIDDIRELREKVKLFPAQGRYKVYIIDEAHMLTMEAFNALLKTLEEPPAHVVFILCTTLVDKLPLTIVSRCSRFDFKRASISELIKALNFVIKMEKIEITDEAVAKIAQLADGSFRDGLSLLDQVAAQKKKITVDDVDKICSLTSISSIVEFINDLIDERVDKAIVLINNLVLEGIDLKRFVNQLVEYLRAILFAANGLLDLVSAYYDQETLGQIAYQAEKWPLPKINLALRLFTEAANSMKSAFITQLPIELAVVELVGKNNMAVDYWSVDNNDKKTENSSSPNKRDKKDNDKENIAINEANKLAVESKQGEEAGDKIDITAKWPTVLEEIRKQNVSVETLLKLARPVNFSGKTLVIEVAYSFHKERIESLSVYKLVSKVVEQVFGVSNVKIVCRLNKEKIVESSAKEDLIQAVTEIFSS